MLKGVRLPDGREVEFSYDPFARRVAKRVSRRDEDGRLRVESHTRFVWDGNVLVHAIRERAQSGGDPIVEERTYVFEDNSFVPMAQRDGAAQGEWFAHVNDPIGTPERLVDARGEVACELRRSAWGETESEGRTGTEVRFQGQWEDEETGLAYNRWRYFAPARATYISCDPIRLRGGVNSYVYAPNPIQWADALGLARYPDQLVGRHTPAQADVHARAKAEERRAATEARSCGGRVTPMAAADADSLIRDANAAGTPVRAKTTDITGEHGFGPVAPAPHIHVDGRHVFVPPGYTPPSGSTVITDAGPTVIP